MKFICQFSYMCCGGSFCLIHDKALLLYPVFIHNNRISVTYDDAFLSHKLCYSLRCKISGCHIGSFVNKKFSCFCRICRYVFLEDCLCKPFPVFRIFQYQRSKVNSERIVPFIKSILVETSILSYKITKFNKITQLYFRSSLQNSLESFTDRLSQFFVFQR